MPIPGDYEERVYAGVLGKIIGVYLGRPFEGWTHERIIERLGEITYYVHERLGQPLIVTDDDISGTFTFLRALSDYGYSPDLTPEQIGQTWLNYIIEDKSILWWGGLGMSTEHTAFLRLRGGVPAPRSGSAALNGTTVAEQIGAQIFIDGWGMVAPGDPERAADLARRAASVSHDGEAIYGAQVVAAIVAHAFVERDLDALLDRAVALIPRDSVIYRLIADVREWRAAEPDWRRTRERIAATYGYDTYGGNCHIVPNHALVIHALLHGDDDFGRSLTIVNTSGWDTDCNSGNVGCILGVKNGLAGIGAGPDFRGPVADRLYLAAADGGRAVTDALTEAYHVSAAGRRLAGEVVPSPKRGARFHFSLPGSVQGFLAEEGPGSAEVTAVENVPDRGDGGARALAVRYRGAGPDRPARIHTATFVPREAREMPGYTLLACPTLYPGQTVRAALSADAASPAPLALRLFIRHYDGADELGAVLGPAATLAPGERRELEWRVPDTGGQPVAQIGVEAAHERPRDGAFYLDSLGWDGAPDLTLGVPPDGGRMWRRAWVEGVDAHERGGEAYRLIQNAGTGLLIQGTREWRDYRVEATLTAALAEELGVCVRVQGMRRYYALTLARGGTARLVRALDGETTLGESPFPWRYDAPYRFSLAVEGRRLRAAIDGRLIADVEDADGALSSGAVALLCREGTITSGAVRVGPVAPLA